MRSATATSRADATRGPAGADAARRPPPAIAGPIIELRIIMWSVQSSSQAGTAPTSPIHLGARARDLKWHLDIPKYVL